ncbi:gamma carbonic anhydrase family protein [Solicola gregarius]|uniref:Gamma carbonic anhydrase family protein n=1 Tax=Solicola gregarius TaxID=2908642 RepID=A0AA46YM11_9ACTN|nr:gamma carbonic anhydrase family protein [Solicola gregarius]UYM07227.1 gamma carbonic anhydrase family protein [Solicola gregarius]
MNDYIRRSAHGVTPQISDTAWIAPGAAVLGDVVLREGASLWYTAVLRGDKERIDIGVDSNLQDGVVVHTDVGFPVRLGTGVSVGHRAVIHGAVIEDNCLIGMGAILLNGAVIGEGSLVAAGTVVLEGTQVPPGSLVAGVPGKVRRELTDEERQGVIDNGRTYVELRETHRSAGPA